MKELAIHHENDFFHSSYHYIFKSYIEYHSIKMSESKVIGESDPPSSSNDRSTFNLPQYGKSMKRIRRSSSESSSLESRSKDDHKQQRKINDKEPSDIQSKQSSKSLPIQSTPTESLDVVGSFVPSAKLRLLQVSFLQNIEIYFYFILDHINK